MERGTHAALLEANGAYAAMWALQARESAESSEEGDKPNVN